MSELENVIENLKKKKCPGYDNLSNELFIDSGKTFRKSVLMIINMAFANGQSPNKWKN